MSSEARTIEDIAAPSTSLRHATKDNAPLVAGRRSFFKYRDLGVTEASNGKLRAQVMQTIGDMKEPTGWHYHECDGQFVYILKGWVDLEFETGKKLRVSEGESLFIPGGLKHNETALSSDSEILELSVPSEMATFPCESPL
jgi:quercetin dioxygenase-like cupin family protein